VIFCRVSASQKRELVTVAKSVLKHRILAIGDGANDVGMIRESHCGIAVYGREGSQAVAAGDFAVDRFECLRRLLLVHGAWCFTRTSELILYTFMHNCSYVFVVFYHQIFNGYSGAVSLHSLCKSYILIEENHMNTNSRFSSLVGEDSLKSYYHKLNLLYFCRHPSVYEFVYCSSTSKKKQNLFVFITLIF
jgi:hypothetical protein